MTVAQRVWDTQAGPGFVSWSTEFPDGTGAAYPGPGTFGTHTSDFTVTRGVAVVVGAEQLIDDVLFAPVTQWAFQGDLLSSGGVDDLSVLGGTEQYADGPIAGSQGHGFDGVTHMSGTSPAPAALRLQGEMSVAIWAYITATIGTFGSQLISCDGDPVPVNDPDNSNWELSIRTTAGRVQFAYEGAANNFHILGPLTPPLATDAWHFIVGTRSAGSAGSIRGRLYVNGETRETSDTLGAVVDGSLARMQFGASPYIPTNLRFTGRLAACTVYDRELTQAECMALYKKGIPEGSR